MPSPATAPNQVRIQLPPLHPAQLAALQGAKRFNIVAAGEGSGKTALGLEALLVGPGGALTTKTPVAWFAATDSELVQIRRKVFKMIEPMIKRRVNARRLELTSGGKIDFYSLEKPLEVFEPYGLIVVDNACQIEGFLDQWEDVMRPMLQQHRGSGWILSNAYGQHNDFHRLWVAAEDDPEWARSTFKSLDNPHLPAEVRAAMVGVLESEHQQRFEAVFHEHAIVMTEEQRALKPGETFLQWCERLETSGLQVDGRPFTLSDRPAMRYIYDLIPSTVDEAFNRVDVIMKCTQVGFTVMEMLAMMYLSMRFSPAKVGMFMPSQPLAGIKSSERFMPIVKTIPQVYALMTGKKASGGRGGDGNVMTRNLGKSKFHFLWTSGSTTTESNPMDIVSFDEVQEMAIADMEKTRERMSASAIRYTLMGSTANWPDADIHWWFKKGTQTHFHTQCPTCGEGQVLDEHFPQCIGFDPLFPRREERMKHILGDYRYRCHKCGGWIDDPQRGEWIERNPGADVRSVHFPQFLSPTISPREMITAYHEADDMKNYFNRKLGKPYTDPSQVPVNLAMLNACAAEGMKIGLRWEKHGKGYFMGLDQMGSFIVAIIKKRLPDNRQAVVHIEFIFRAPTEEDPERSPWQRADELMKAYGIQCCVVETLPNYDSAKSFARRHHGKVFLAGYGNMDGEMLVWGDAPKLDASDRRTDEDARDRYTVRLDQYKCMQVAMSRFQRKMCLFPDPSALVQDVLEKGQMVPSAVCKDHAFLHFTRTALIAEKDEEEKKFKRRVVKVGIDPHTSYANMLCDVAWARSHGTTMFLMPEVQKDYSLKVEEVVRLPEGIAGPIEHAMDVHAESLRDCCGACAYRDAGLCSETGLLVRMDTPGCIMFQQAP